MLQSTPAAFSIAVHEGERQNLNGKFCFGFQLVQFGPDSHGLFIYLPLGLDFAVTAPTGLLLPFLYLVSQNRFDTQCRTAGQQLSGRNRFSGTDLSLR